MIRVERLVTPEAKSFCSTNSVRLPARAHSRATATPLMPPPMTTTWKFCPSTDDRGLRLRLMDSGRCRVLEFSRNSRAEGSATYSDSAPERQENEGHDGPRSLLAKSTTPSAKRCPK